MLNLLAMVLLIASSIGGGTAVLRATGLLSFFAPTERIIWSFVLGAGVLGWVVFFAILIGYSSPLEITVTCLPLLAGLYWLRFSPQRANWQPLAPLEKLLVAAMALVLVFDFLEGLSPPTDADSLAYHFALPKYFLETGKLTFIPRANTGAIPLLQHMTYFAALGLSGERAMTLWAMISGWGAAALLYCILRHHVSRIWALSVTLIFLTTPAVIYGAGTGQVEIRNAMFLLAGAYAVGQARYLNDTRFTALAGIAIGFCVASKYPGLLYAFSCGLVLLFQRGWVRHILVYCTAIAIVGSQWYLWNWWHSGDPVFPVLYGWLTYQPEVPWNELQNIFYKVEYAVGEKYFVATALNAILYPFIATFIAPSEFESSRTGFGPFIPLAIPLAAIGIYLCRSQVWRSPLFSISCICFISYLLWFFLGPSQRIRFHLPIYPLLVLVFSVAAFRALELSEGARNPAALLVIAVISVQITAHGIYSVNPLKRFAMNENREQYLARNNGLYRAATWINTNLKSHHKIHVSHREIVYLITVPVFHSNPIVEARVETRPDNRDPIIFWKQLAAQNITHILSTSPSPGMSKGGLGFLVEKLINAACLKILQDIPVHTKPSRSLSIAPELDFNIAVFKLLPRQCTLARN